MSTERVSAHLANLETIFDAAKLHARPSYRFASDISDLFDFADEFAQSNEE